MSARLGIVCALETELALLAAWDPRATRPARAALATATWSAVVSGPGPERASRAAETLCNAGARALLSFGFAGGLVPELAAGSVVVPSAVVRADGGRLATDSAWHSGVAALLGADALVDATLAESHEVLATSGAKCALARRTGAVAVDQESAAIGAAALAANRPWLVLRAVCDPVAQPLPACALAGVDDAGRVRLGALCRALARRPRELGALVRLARSAASAKRALALALERLGPELGSPSEPARPGAARRTT